MLDRLTFSRTAVDASVAIQQQAREKEVTAEGELKGLLLELGQVIEG